MSMNEQLACLRMAGALKSSTEVMRNMQSLVKVPEIMKSMREMSMEMTKMGIIEDMIEDTMESMEPAGLEEQAQVCVLFCVAINFSGRSRQNTVGDHGRRAGQSSCCCQQSAGRADRRSHRRSRRDDQKTSRTPRIALSSFRTRQCKYSNLFGIFVNNSATESYLYVPTTPMKSLVHLLACFQLVFPA